MTSDPEIRPPIAPEFHKHLDECIQCRNNPMMLCSVGARLLQEMK